MPGGPESHLDELRYSQPGLEVVPNSCPKLRSPKTPSSAHTLRTPSAEDLAPEVSPYEYNNKAGWYGPEVVPQQWEHDKVFLNASPLPSKEETPGLEPISTLGQERSRRRRFIWIGILSLILIAAVVGGVVGWLASRTSHTGNNDSAEAPMAQPVASKTATNTSPGDPTATSSPTATVTLESLRPDSRLAVTGWRADGGFKIRIFYQDRNGTLRFSDYSSGEVNWSSSTKASASGVMAGTPLGAAAVVQDTPPQYELFWLNSSSMLSGQNFRDGFTPLGGTYDSIDEYPVAVNHNSRIAMYWPYAVTQDNGGLRLVTYLAGAQGGPWSNQSLDISGAEGTAMAIIPRTSTYALPYTAGLVYRGHDGRLAGYSLQWTLSGLQWDISTTSTIPEDTAMAAFAVAKENDPGNATLVYVAYQNAENDIALLIYDDVTWTSSPSVLKGADPGTDIACLTEALWGGVNVLSSQHDMSRCYFLSGGQIREVLYNGTGWEELGNIPLT